MTSRLIVNADDFGYSPGVTKGIIEAHRRGIVTSTTVMVNSPYAAEAIAQAVTDTPRLGLGVHLTLTSGSPVLTRDEVPDLVGANGNFYSRDEAFARLPYVPASQIESEFRAQIKRFVKLAGRPPDHLDSHHHASYCCSATVNAMVALSREFDTGIRRPLPDEPLATIARAMGFGSDAAGLATREIEALATTFNSSLLPMPDHFIMSFYKATATLGDLLNLLTSLPVGTTELMCHPAYVDPVLSEKSSYTGERVQELEALTHPSVQEIIEAEEIKLITFGALLTR
jgi:chitin disaccharide deacetylase